MQFLSKIREHGVLMSHIGQGKIRAVTHHGITEDDISRVLISIRHTLIELQV